jgi:hypothetical protein
LVASAAGAGQPILTIQRFRFPFFAKWQLLLKQQGSD